MDFVEIPVKAGIVLDDTLSDWMFSSGWSSGSVSDRYNGSYHYINTTGNQTTTIKFTGDNVKFYTRVGPDQQILNIHVDSQPDEAIDLYRTSQANRVLVWQKSNLSPGSHIITITTTGTKNVSSTNYWAEVDCIEVSSDNDIPLDDAQSDWTYSSGWSAGSASDRYNGSYHTINTTQSNETATIKFTGTGIMFYTRVGPDQQILNIRVDGQANEAVDLYSPGFSNQVLVWQKYGLSPGSHILTITTTGTKNSSSSNYYAEVDYVKVTNVLDDAESKWTFGTGWSVGNSDTRYNGASHYCNTGGNTATLTFSGTGILLITRVAPDQQKINIHVDSQADETVDLYRPQESNRTIVWQKYGLSPGTHTITITTTGTKNPSSSGYYAEVDYVLIK